MGALPFDRAHDREAQDLGRAGQACRQVEDDLASALWRPSLEQGGESIGGRVSGRRPKRAGSKGERLKSKKGSGADGRSALQAVAMSLKLPNWALLIILAVGVLISMGALFLEVRNKIK